MILALLLACRSPEPAARPAGAQEASFEYAWRRVGESYPDPAMKGLDWAGIREELLPRAREAATAADVRPVITELFSRLEESHFALIPSEFDPSIGGGSGEVGWRVTLVEGTPRVVRLEPGGPAAAAGVGLGWAVEGVGKVEVAELQEKIAAAVPDPRLHHRLLESRLLAAASGAPGSTVVARLRDGAGELREVTMQRRQADGEVVQMGLLPEIPVSVTAEILRAGEAEVGYFAFDAFLTPALPAFTAAISEWRGRELGGLILDLRGNPGGLVPIARGVAGHLISQPGASLGVMTTREAALHLTVHPRPAAQRFDGPVAVLIDGGSASTSEILAGGLQELGRAIVVGEPSAGMALPSIVERLPNGDRIQFVIADLTTPSGARLEGSGVRPDVAAPYTAAALLAGRDPMIEAALEAVKAR